MSDHPDWLSTSEPWHVERYGHDDNTIYPTPTPSPSPTPHAHSDAYRGAAPNEHTLPDWRNHLYPIA